ncbi:hypothetical protein [Sulfitobacter sabulilitoris]|uniref:Uncharacterized protein n=1 Tax=Sulfitobacter sabulilitoris TaxID=2562655 RepID=A0A5S3PIR2_9RHOB|nr:hypothetical protein [Sulfitobacter sabulilitoris]TMM54207.1 hypothetical protein FDT80_01000 [Sulfitobacter sabulilitoris]
MAFFIALILVAVFTANVAVGAASNAPLLGNVAEMLLLFAASISFVVGILKREARAKADKKINH